MKLFIVATLLLLASAQAKAVEINQSSKDQVVDARCIDSNGNFDADLGADDLDCGNN